MLEFYYAFKIILTLKYLGILTDINRLSAMETIRDVNGNLENVVRIFRDEGTRFCQMQR